MTGRGCGRLVSIQGFCLNGPGLESLSYRELISVLEALAMAMPWSI